MTIERFFTTTAVVIRMAAGEDESGNYYQEESEVGSITGHLQQADHELAVSLGLTVTKTFSFWCPVTSDIQDGDKLRIGSTGYTVKAVMVLDASPRNPHINAILERLEGVYGGS